MSSADAAEQLDGSTAWSPRPGRAAGSAARRCAASSASRTASSTTGRAPTSCARRSPTRGGAARSARYSYRDLVRLKVVKNLLDAGVKLQTARKAIEYLREDLGDDWATASLVLDGTELRARAHRRRARSTSCVTARACSTSCRSAPWWTSSTPACASTSPSHRDVRRGRLTIRRSRCPTSTCASRTTPNGSSRSCSTSTRIEWEYEPRTFVLERDRDGNPRRRSRPDFYLPAYDLYIEITTLNQKLVTKKNRKARRLAGALPRRARSRCSTSATTCTCS